MAKIIPFKAVRPVSDKVGLVTSRSYEDYGAAELAAHLEFNPFSFLHILNPAYVNQQRLGWETRFRMVENKYQDFKKEEILIQEKNPVFYVYEIQTKENCFTGILAGTALDDYKNNIIKKHEDTLQYRVDLFKDYLHKTGFNAEPVLMTYTDNATLNSWISDKKTTTPLYQFSTTNKEKHTLWKIEEQSEIEWLQNKFQKIGDLYIADGHHRTASAELLYEQDKASGNENLNYFMSFLISDENLKIYEYNRIIRDLNGNSNEDFIKKVAEHFVIKSKKQELWQPKNKFEFGMYFDGSFYALRLKEDQFDFGNALEKLDAQILYNTILSPILALGDLRTDERIEYISGKQSILKIKQKIDSGEFAVGFMLFPSNMTEIKEIADLGLIMPPKSTYIEPKFRSGLVVYEL